MKAMKTIIKSRIIVMKVLLILFTILGIRIAPIEAAPYYDGPTSGTDISLQIRLLVPVTPAEATFEDITEFIIPNQTISLAPTTPVDASFDDDTIGINAMQLNFLAPVTPLEAGFNEE
jgi:hypothetical protein